MVQTRPVIAQTVTYHLRIKCLGGQHITGNTYCGNFENRA